MSIVSSRSTNWYHKNRPERTYCHQLAIWFRVAPPSQTSYPGRGGEDTLFFEVPTRTLHLYQLLGKNYPSKAHQQLFLKNTIAIRYGENSRLENSGMELLLENAGLRTKGWNSGFRTEGLNSGLRTHGRISGLRTEVRNSGLRTHAWSSGLRTQG